MTPRQSVENVLNGKKIDKVPFTVYSNMIFSSQAERELRNDGLCLITYKIMPYVMENENITTETHIYLGGDGITREKRTYHTAAGTVSETYKVLAAHPRIALELRPWHEEYLFSGPEDYAPISAMLQDRKYIPNYEAFQKHQEEAGGDTFFAPSIPYSPLQELIVEIMGIENFSTEWHERRDALMKLYDILTEDRRKMYPIVADSSAMMIGYGGNIVPEIVGPQRFKEFILPHYNELADILHQKGKLMSVHFDGNTALIASAIAESKIDCIEAFDPSNDMTVAEARAAWPDKILWINFPSAIHLDRTSVIEETTRQILREAVPGDRFLIGVTENVPHDKWPHSFAAISRVLKTEGKLPLR